MPVEVYRYEFNPDVSLADVETTLVLAIMSAESLHGQSQVRLDASHCVDQSRRECVIDAGTPVGKDINRLFAGYLCREFGDGQFRVERVISTKRDPALRRIRPFNTR